MSLSNYDIYDQISVLNVIRHTNPVFQDMLYKFREMTYEVEFMQPQLEELMLEVHEHQRTIDLMESANKFLVDENIKYTKKIKDLETQLANIKTTGVYSTGIQSNGISGTLYGGSHTGSLGDIFGNPDYDQHI